MELCGDCKYYCETKSGRGCCKARQTARVYRNTNFHCFNWKEAENGRQEAYIPRDAKN